MTFSLMLALLASGFIYGITPGPGVLVVFAIGAARGRRAAASFLCGHLLGDCLWYSTALVAIIGARQIGSVAFDVLGLISGLYLFWLGLRAARTRTSAAAQGASGGKPFWHGMVFGLTNPKAYPVAVATFTALLSSRASSLSWAMLPALVLVSFVGGVLAYSILVGVVGSARVRRFYLGHDVLITRLCGVMFIGFAFNALFHAIPGLWKGLH